MLILLLEQPKNLEGEKESFSFPALSKAVGERLLHICYSAQTQTAKHVTVLPIPGITDSP